MSRIPYRALSLCTANCYSNVRKLVGELNFDFSPGQSRRLAESSGLLDMSNRDET